MTDREMRERMHAERAEAPAGFAARQDALLARLTAGGALRGAMPAKRRMAFALALTLLLIGGAASASGYLRLTRFWREANPEAERLVQSGIAQTGGELSGVSFAVREAVFDGRTVEALVEVRGEEGFQPMEEGGEELEGLLCKTDWTQTREAERTLAVGCDVCDVSGASLSSGAGASMREEDGTLLLYVSDVLEETVRAQSAQVTLTCWTYPASDPQKRQTAELAFALPVMEQQKAACDMSADMEGWLTVMRVEASYTPLSMELTIAYRPGERLKRAMPMFYVEDGGRRGFWQDLGGQTAGGDGTYTVRLVCPKASTLPGALTLGVEGLDSTLAIDFAAGTAVVERCAEVES